MNNDARLEAKVEKMAQWLWQARARRLPYRNLPDELRPASIAEAYAAQEAYHRLAEPSLGAVAGAKIATTTTTKVMQQLMGITHPCGGAIFSRTIHHSPAKLHARDFVNLRIESEIALKLSADLPAAGAPWTRAAVAPAITPKPVRVDDLVGIAGRLMLGGKLVGEGAAEGPCATLVWLANHVAARGRDLKAGMVVITGSLITTVSIAAGRRAVFTVDGLGETVMDVV
jgi:2-oxo-3-hexenedioate decarboxylase/2-keto-4-pentenoate hydratase